MADLFEKYPPLHACGTTMRVYVSKATGLRGMLMETGEPLSQLHVVIATESDTHDWTHKDDGLPHTLEHAIFLGSERFPYKGVLDKLANRSLADGTNAWTATDHTCYTMQSAGHEGVLNLLPIYADHILYPTLSDECFHTEVHHVTGEGEDKGVVYCEMQARENNDSSLVDRKILDLLYPSGGYSSETGGKMHNLHTLTNGQVRRYHSEAYRPDNMMFILSGTAAEDDFLRALGQVETAVRAKGTSPGERPWGQPVAPMTQSGVEGVLTDQGKAGRPVVVPFPSEADETGTVSMGWRGPSYGDQRTWVALKLLWKYLTESAIAPLTKAFVECDEPLCTDVGPASEVFSEGYHQVWFEDAACETIDQIPTRFFETLRAAIDDFDAERMRVVIQRRRRKILEERERSPTDAVVSEVIEHFLYGPRGVGGEAEMASLHASVDVLLQYPAVLGMSCAQWQELMREYILQPACACVVGKPQASLSAEIAAGVTARVEATKAAQGEAGLKAFAEALERAIAYNERDIPEEFQTAVPIPDYASVRSFPILAVRGATELAIAPKSGQGVPPETATTILDGLRASLAADGSAMGAYWTEWCHLDSAFVSVAVALDTAALTARQRLYLPLLLEVAFKLPCTLDDGTQLSKDEFVGAIQEDTVKYSAEYGLVASGSPQLLSFFVQVELGDECDGLQLALKWVRRALYLTEPTAEALKTGVSKLLGNIPGQIRDGATIAGALRTHLNYDAQTSNTVAAAAIAQKPFLASLKSQLETDEGAARALADLNAIRSALVRPEAINCFCAADMTKLPTATVYRALAAAMLPPAKLAPAASPPAATGALPRVRESYVLSARRGEAVVCALSASESQFLYVTGDGVGPYSDDHAALLVAIEHLTALEGDFWVKLRGPGLTYSYGIKASTDSARVVFSLFKSVDVSNAYVAARKIIEEYATGVSVLSQVALDGAKSTLAYSIISATSTRLSTAASAWESSYHEKGVDYGKWLLSQVDKVTIDDVLHALRRYIVPLFDGSCTNVAATCPQNKLDELCDAMGNHLGIDVRKLHEEELFTAFAGDKKAAAEASAAADVHVPAKKKGTAAFGFAKQFKCECPKCGPTGAPIV